MSHHPSPILEPSDRRAGAELACERSAAMPRIPAEYNDRTVLLDLHEVTSIDSSHIALFMEAMQRITAHGGDLVLFGIRDEVRRVFATARLDQVFRVFATREEALADRARLLRGHTTLN